MQGADGGGHAETWHRTRGWPPAIPIRLHPLVVVHHGEWPAHWHEHPLPGDKGVPARAPVRTTSEQQFGCGALCQPVIQEQSMIELTLKVKVTAAQIKALGRFVLLLLALLA